MCGDGTWLIEQSNNQGLLTNIKVEGNVAVITAHFTWVTWHVELMKKDAESQSIQTENYTQTEEHTSKEGVPTSKQSDYEEGNVEEDKRKRYNTIPSRTWVEDQYYE